MPGPAKVLFVAGWGRSGTTLLDMLLGQMAGFFSAGEVRYVWDRGILENRPCGCSLPFRDCSIWTEAIADFRDQPRSEIEKIVRLRDEFRSRHCWRTVTGPGRRRLARQHRQYANNLARIMTGLTRATGARVIVDSSKFPSHGSVLEMIDELELYVIHLIRDPRAVAYSWLRKRVYDVGTGGPRFIRPQSASRSSLMWLSWNAIIEAVWGRWADDGRYYRLRYEDLISRPERELAEIARRLGESVEADFLESGSAHLTPCHMVAGNPARFRTGKIELKLDEEWSSSMSRGAKTWVTLLCLPLLRRYGYLGKGP